MQIAIYHSFGIIKISSEMLMGVNEYLLSHKDDGKDDYTSPSAGISGDGGTEKEDTNKGTQFTSIT